MTIETITTWLVENWQPIVTGALQGWCAFAMLVALDTGKRNGDMTLLVAFWPITVPVLLATWPIRALWRWWHKTPSKFQQLDAILNRQAILDSSPKPVPTVFADAKGYADSANAPDRVGREELDAVKAHCNRLSESIQHLHVDTQDLVYIRSRLAALEEKPSPFTLGGIGIGIGGIGRMGYVDPWLQAHKTASELLRAKVAPAPVVPEVRVFKDSGLGLPVYHVFSGNERAFRGTKCSWVDDVPAAATICDYERAVVRGLSGLVELGSGPEKDAIVAEWRAWREEQK